MHGDPINYIDPTGEGAAAVILARILAWAAVGAGFFGGRAALKGADGHGIARDAAVGAFILGMPFASFGLGQWLLGGGKGVALGAFLSIPGAASAISEFWGAYQKDTAQGVGGLNVTPRIRPLRDELAIQWVAAGRAGTQQQTMDFVLSFNPLKSLGAWDIQQMYGANKAKWIHAVPGMDSLPKTLTYKSNVYAVAEVNYVLFGMLQRSAWHSNILTSMTNYYSTLSLVTIYRTLYGGINNVLLWIQEGFGATMYETTTGKVAFTDHGWELLTAPGFPILNADPPIEASLGLGAIPTINAFPARLIFEAGPIVGAKRLLTNG